jgi:NAD(P)-dependent dehydrogenase (short-subunit alcohol dehydrogenase family)
MVTEVIAREEHRYGLHAYALAPGVVDTDMQTVIRSTPAQVFPEVGRFQQRYEDGAFNSADWVARFILDRVGIDLNRKGPGSTLPVPPVRIRVPDQKDHR